MVLPKRAWVFALLTIVFWSSAYVGIRIGLTAFSAWHVVLLRFLTASVVLLAGVLASGGRILPPRGAWWRVAAAGLTGFSIYHTALTLGERTVDANTASFIIASAPLFSTLLARLFLAERLSRWAWVGTGLSFLGVGVISGFGQGWHWNALLIVLSAMSTAVFFVLERPLLDRYRALEVTSWVTWAGTLPMLLYAYHLPEAVARAPLYPLLWVLYIGVFPAALAYVTWSLALAAAPIGQVTPVLYLNPILASLLGWTVLGERPTWGLAVGGLLVLGGVYVIQVRGRPPAATTALAMATQEGGWTEHADI